MTGLRPDDQPRLEIPEYAEVLTITHVLELPRDLGLPNGLMFGVFEFREDCFQGWPDEAKAQYVYSDSLPTPGTAPTNRFVFRRVRAPERAQLVAAYVAFDDWITANMSDEEIAERRAMVQGYLDHGAFGWITVVAATRFVNAQTWPNDEDDRAKAQLAELDKGFEVLNDFLVSLGIARSDTSVSTIALGDLPRLCPVILETAPTPTGERNAISTVYQIHDLDPHKYGENRSQDQTTDEERRALDLAKLAYFGNESWFLYYELSNRAVGSLNEGRHRTCVLEIGTAVEVLLSTVIRAAGAARGMRPAEYGAILELPFRNRVEQHLPRLVNCTVDLADPANPFGRWWRGGYVLRNLVAHEGYGPDY